MRARLTASALAMLVMLAIWPAHAHAAAKVRRCGTVVFTPNSEDGAFRVRAKGVGCKTARAVARGARGRGPSGEVGRTYTYRARGFTCRGTEIEDGLPAVDYRCTRSGARITFQKG